MHNTPIPFSGVVQPKPSSRSTIEVVFCVVVVVFWCRITLNYVHLTKSHYKCSYVFCTVNSCWTPTSAAVSTRRLEYYSNNKLLGLFSTVEYSKTSVSPNFLHISGYHFDLRSSSAVIFSCWEAGGGPFCCSPSQLTGCRLAFSATLVSLAAASHHMSYISTSSQLGLYLLHNSSTR